MTGAVVLVVGVLAVLVGLVQPWASCPDVDDSSAGCPAGAVTRTVMSSGLALAGLGGALGATALLVHPRRR